MSAVTTDSLAREWAGRLERKEAERNGISLSAARAKVARRVGASPGTLENLSRNRLKGVREWLFSNLFAAVMAEVEREIAALQHEHQTLLALGRGTDDATVQQVAAGIKKLRSLMQGKNV